MSLKQKSLEEFKEENGCKRTKKNEEDDSTEFLLNICQSEIISFSTFNKTNMNVRYAVIFSKKMSNEIYKILEEEVNYTLESFVKLFGKLIKIPRQQQAYGDTGLTYSFSGVTVKAVEWIPVLKALKRIVERLCQCEFNFVLVNRYKNGSQYMGYHQDNEKDLDETSPIASLSFGQSRDFLFKHVSSKGGHLKKEPIPNVKLLLEHGSLLIMDPPTNQFWYHSLPKRSTTKCLNPRINLTFRKMKLHKK